MGICQGQITTKTAKPSVSQKYIPALKFLSIRSISNLSLNPKMITCTDCTHTPSDDTNQVQETTELLNTLYDSEEKTPSKDSISIQTPTVPSKLLYTMTTSTLAAVIQYLVENVTLFQKYKDESEEVHDAVLCYKLKGKMLFELNTIEFCNEIRWIRKPLTMKIYNHLRSLSDDTIQTLIDAINKEETPCHLQIEGSDRIYDDGTLYITLPHYLKQIDIINDTKKVNNIQMYSTHEFYIYVYILCIINEYNENERDLLIQSLIKTGLNGTEFIQLTRMDLFHILKAYHIKGAVCSKLYKLIITNSDNIIGYFDQHTIKLQLNTECNVPFVHNDNDFVSFVHNLCIEHQYNINDIESIMRALRLLNMNGKEFMKLKKVDFCRKVKSYDIKGGMSSKLYKLIVTKYVGLTCNELAEIAVSNFQENARRMLLTMNESLKTNQVNGITLINHCSDKWDLETYLIQNVKGKSVNKLAEMLWNDYIKDRENNIKTIKGFTRKEVLKYIIHLYREHVKEIIIKNDINESACLSMKRKDLCQILVSEFNFGIGVAINIANTIYERIGVCEANR